MKKIMLFVGVLAVVGAVGATQARAQNANAAITLKDKEHPVGCYAFGLHTTDRIHTVSNAGGMTKLTCHFNIPEGQRPTKVETQTGFGCGIFLPHGSKFTNDTSFTKNPGGEAKLECTLKL